MIFALHTQTSSNVQHTGTTPAISTVSSTQNRNNGSFFIIFVMKV